MLRALCQKLFFSAMVLGIIGTALGCTPAFAEVNRIDQGQISIELNLPVYEWKDSNSKPKAIVMAIHGLTMHGTVYDTWARKLAAEHIVVAAPDLRGYGQWYASGELKSVQYKESEKDLVALAQSLRSRYRGIPLFVAGESLGGTMAVRLAAQHPELVDGLILSAPALRHYHRIPLATLADLCKVVVNPAHKVDISAYLKHYFSDDPEVSAEGIADPLIRKNLNVREIVSSCNEMDGSADFISAIPADMPVLILQGEKDQMVKLESVGLLESKLRTKNQTVCWFPERGHILLETAYVRPETVDAVDSWIAHNCTMRTVDTTVTASLEQEVYISIDERAVVN